MTGVAEQPGEDDGRRASPEGPEGARRAAPASEAAPDPAPNPVRDTAPVPDADAEETQPPPKGIRRVLAWVGIAVLAGAASVLSAVTEDAIGRVGGVVTAPFRDVERPVAPIAVKTESVGPYDSCLNQEGMVFPHSIDALSGFGAAHSGPVPPMTEKKSRQAEAAAAAWDSAHGGVPSDVNIFYVHVQGRDDREVTLTGLSVHVREVREAPEGVRMIMSTQCGETNESRFTVQTDARNPRVRFLSGRADSGEKRVKGFPVRVSAQDTENLEIVAHSLHKETRHTFSLDWVSGDESGTYEITAEGGEPFAVASSKRAKAYSFEGYPGAVVKPAPKEVWDGQPPWAARQH